MSTFAGDAAQERKARFGFGEIESGRNPLRGAIFAAVSQAPLHSPEWSIAP
jgi:hypothetical protein